MRLAVELYGIRVGTLSGESSMKWDADFCSTRHAYLYADDPQPLGFPRM